MVHADMSARPRRLVVVSNRVGDPRKAAAGGLAVALGDALSGTDGLWFGWSGQIADTSGELRQRQLGRLQIATIDLDQADHDGYYLGHANQALWPSFHSRLDLASFETGFVTGYPLTIRHRDGRLTDVLYNASVYRGAAGNVLGVFAAARDVTLQKQASQYARSLVEASLDPLVTIDAEGKITDVNEAAVNVTGVPRQALIGTDFSDYFTEPQKARGACREVFEKGFVTDYPLTIRHKDGALRKEGTSREERFVFLRPDGSTLPVEFRARAFELGGRKFVQAHLRDISERLRAEAQLQAQIDELRRFKNVTVDRELRMQELEERFARLETQQAAAG